MKALNTIFTGVLAAMMSVGGVAAADWGSVYTDVKRDCIEVSVGVEIDFYEAQCKSFGGYQMSVKGGDLRYGPELVYNGVDLGAVHQVGAFHDLAANKIEWVYNLKRDLDGSGEIVWSGLIYRLEVSIYDDNKGDFTGTKNTLFAVRLDGEKTCLIGEAKSNEQARQMVYNSKPGCK